MPKIVASVKEIFASKGIVISNSEIRNSNKAALEVYSVTGKRVASSKENISLNGFSKGIYIVREVASGQSLKFTILYRILYVPDKLASIASLIDLS